MNLEKYEYKVSTSLLEYEFDSVGPNGSIGKIVSFDRYDLGDLTFFSLAFGDYIKETAEIDVLVISDNRDTEKVLATVFSILFEFVSHFPNKLVYAIGSTVARTRLYQIGITKYWNYIEPVVLVYGKYDGNWEPFEKNIQYEAFLFAKR